MAKIPDEVQNAIFPGTAPAASSLPGEDWIKEAEAQQPAPVTSSGRPVAAPATQQQPPAKEEGGSSHEIFTVPFGEFVRDFKPLEWLVYGYIQKNALEMCFGPSGAGKSFVALDMAYAVSVLNLSADESNSVIIVFMVSVRLINRFKVHKRTVAVKDKNIVVGMLLNKLSCLHNRVARTELRRLKRSLNILIKPCKIVLYHLMLIAGNNANILGACLFNC